MRLPATSRIALALGLALCLPMASVQAADAAKVDQLLTLMNLEANVAQMQVLIGQSIDQGLAVRMEKDKMTEAQRARAVAMTEVMKKNFAQIMSWDAMAPEYRAIYQDVLSNEEVDAAIAYYRTPAGASMLAKTPQLMQRSMVVGQKRAAEIMPRLQAEMDRVLQDAKADTGAKAEADSAPAKAD